MTAVRFRFPTTAFLITGTSPEMCSLPPRFFDSSQFLLILLFDFVLVFLLFFFWFFIVVFWFFIVVFLSFCFEDAVGPSHAKRRTAPKNLLSVSPMLVYKTTIFDSHAISPMFMAIQSFQAATTSTYDFYLFIYFWGLEFMLRQ